MRERASKMAVEGSASSGTTTSYGGMADARGGQGPGQGASTTSSDILFEQVIPVHIKVRRNRAFGERMRSAPGSLGLLRSFDSQRPQTSVYPVATVSRATALDHDDSLAPCFAPLFFLARLSRSTTSRKGLSSSGSGSLSARLRRATTW